MHIIGKCKKDYQEWNFSLEDKCYGYVNFVTELTFDNGYYDFKYQFKDITDFQEQYTTQEKNLFKYFFNDTTIDYDSLSFDFNDYDLINIFEKISQLNPYLYSLIRKRIDYYWELTEYIQDNFKYAENEYKKFSYYLSDLIWYATKEVDNLTVMEIYSFMFCNGMDRYRINEIKELHKEGTLKIISDNLGFDEIDQKYIDFALSINTKKIY